MNEFYNDNDHKLRQLENQSLPDLSKQEEHWQGMKTMLQPAIEISKPANQIKIWKWIVAACIIGGLCFIVYDRQTNNSASKPTKSIVSVKDTAATEIKVTPDQVSVPVITVDQKMVTTKITEKKYQRTERKVVDKTPVQKIPHIKQEFVQTPSHKTEVVTKTITDPAIDKATLARFFSQLEKPSQHFVINNKRDTVLWGQDGSALLILANTFYTNEKVTITLKEYYSYEDIITNKLSTASDGAQLITGGMIYLEATVNNKKVNMLNQKSIRWFLPDTSAEMENMQLFTGREENNSTTAGISHAVATNSGSNNSINWRVTAGSFSKNYITTKLKVLDFRDYPFKTKSNNKYKGYFILNKESGLTKGELKEILQKKYPSYDKIIVSRARKKKEWDAPWYTDETDNRSETYYSIGDTTWVYPYEAKAYKLEVYDTLTYTNRGSLVQSTPELNKHLKKAAGKYSVDLNSLGWVNCDRFYRSNRAKIDYIVDIGEHSSGYYTILVFDRIKSMMEGAVSGNNVVFTGVPEGEKARVFSVGIKDGKPVAALEKVIITRSSVPALKFEETSPAEFKENAAMMDK